jgi:hypothetical protein
MVISARPCASWLGDLSRRSFDEDGSQSITDGLTKTAEPYATFSDIDAVFQI